MTAEMEFECVLVSRDPGVLCTMNRVLEKFSISTCVCFTSTKASDRLAGSGADLVVVDYDESMDDLIQEIYKPDRRQKPTIVAVSEVEQAIPGAHLTVRKPLTGESCTQSVKFAYVKMLRDHRRYARHALMASVTARDASQRTIPITVLDIGDGGIGFMTRKLVAVGTVLSFQLLLPGAQRAISIEARVLWTRQYGAAGCEFVRIPPVDLGILHDWLRSKCRVKRPLVEL